jgi:two-component system cell cycle response regulator
MVRLLIVEDDSASAELTVRTLERAGFDCRCEQVSREADFREALTRGPDLILSDSNVPGFSGWSAMALARSARPETPFILVSGHLDEATRRRAIDAGAAGCCSKSDLEQLPSLIRPLIQREAVDSPASGERRLALPDQTSETARFLLERRAVLDQALAAQDQSAMAQAIRRTPPKPAALVMMESTAFRGRFLKLLRNANIELELPSNERQAVARLDAGTHALMFTDSLGLIRDARQLRAAAATHMVWVHSTTEGDPQRGLRAGANDCMPCEPDGEAYWAKLTLARRIVSLAASLHVALTDNHILSAIDELTRCGSRRFFEHQFPRELARAVQLVRPLTLIVCDIDHFKSINDTYGHETGDEVLREFSDRLTDGLRMGEDWVARVGGEEFAVVLPEVAELQGRAVAERLREHMAGSSFSAASGVLHVTASFGLCSLLHRPADVRATAKALFKAADAAMYQSKRAGRNQVTVAAHAGGPKPGST